MNEQKIRYAWNKGLTANENEIIQKARETLKAKYQSGELVGSWTGRHHSDETKRKISEKRSQWLRKHPDEHPWRKSSKFKSAPCEELKLLLKNAGINFVEEFNEFEEHNYSIDIAFPFNKIGIEVNGNQHYNNDGSLTEYYQKREDYLKSIGWKIYQIHYSLIYNKDLINHLIDALKKDIKNIDLDYSIFIKSKKVRKCEVCSRIVKYDLQNGLCKICFNKKEKELEISRKCELILKSNIDFSKFGWVGQVSKILGIHRNKGGAWVKQHMPEFFEKNCFKRKR